MARKINFRKELKNMKNEDRFQFLQMIQAIIARMAECSLKMKEWFITIVCAIAVAYVATDKPAMLFAISIASVLFWILDSNYLRNEKIFRAMYKDNCIMSKPIDSFEMNIVEYKRVKGCRKRDAFFFSWSTIVLYGSLFLVSAAVGIVFMVCNIKILPTSAS